MNAMDHPKSVEVGLTGAGLRYSESMEEEEDTLLVLTDGNKFSSFPSPSTHAGLALRFVAASVL